MESQDRAEELFFFDTAPEDLPAIQDGHESGSTSSEKIEPRTNEQQPLAEDDIVEAEAALERKLFGPCDIGLVYAGPAGQEDIQHDRIERQPAWEDEDDQDVRINIAAKDRLRKLRQTPEETEISGTEFHERLRARLVSSKKSAPKWAGLLDERLRSRKRKRAKLLGFDGDSTSAGDETDDAEALADMGLFRSTVPLVASAPQRKNLQPGHLEINRVKDANLQEPSQAVIQAVQFQPSDTGLLLTAGLDKTLRLFQVDGKHNEKLASVFFPDLPIQSACWIGQGHSEVLLSGRRSFFYSYDVDSGAVQRTMRIMGRQERSWERCAASPDGKLVAFTAKDGYVVLISAKTKQWIGEYKMNGTARAVCFDGTSETLWGSGSDAVVYGWDLRHGKCLSRFENEGGTVTSALAACSSSQAGYVAVGSESGVVNLYDAAAVSGLELTVGRAVKPVRAVLNLTTTIDTLTFNHDGQLLILASRWKRDALRMLHVPSRTVFSNWPTGRSPIRYPFSASFSPKSGAFAIGNDRGRALLYRLGNYDAQ